MADDLANGWGCTLVHLDGRSSRQFVEGNGFKRLEEVVRKTTKQQFTLAKVAACGSDANVFATLEATNGNTSRMCIAAGSYVAGDHSILQNWSSSHFDIHDGLALISDPSEVHSEIATEHTVALPYRIPCDSCLHSINQVEEYEDLCLDSLHARLLSAKLFNRPFNSLLLELVLGGNGASLSIRAYNKLALICRHHHINCVVDEALTGARCGPSMLLTQTLPLDFQNVVTHVTMAKWPGIGMVLLNEKNKTETASSKRGQSTEISCDYAIKLWETADSLLHIIPDRRKAVLKAMKLSETDAWGTGLMLYGPKRRNDSKKSLKNRYLPLLASTPVDKINFQQRADMTKECVCQNIKRMVMSWVNHYPKVLEKEERGDHGLVGWLFCQEISKPGWKGRFFRREDMSKALQDSGHPRAVDVVVLRGVLKTAVEADILSETQNGVKRTRGYKVLGICHLDSSRKV